MQTGHAKAQVGGRALIIGDRNHLRGGGTVQPLTPERQRGWRDRQRFHASTAKGHGRLDDVWSARESQSRGPGALGIRGKLEANGTTAQRRQRIAAGGLQRRIHQKLAGIRTREVEAQVRR